MCKLIEGWALSVLFTVGVQVSIITEKFMNGSLKECLFYLVLFHLKVIGVLGKSSFSRVMGAEARLQ